MPAALSIQERVFKWSDVDPVTGCWNWIGSKGRDGYGSLHMKVGGRMEWLAHRASYRTFVGEIPNGHEIDHKCKNRACINPDHLRTMTHAENVRLNDHVTNQRNAVKTHCIRGHELAGSNLLIEIWRGRKARKCRACIKARRKKAPR